MTESLPEHVERKIADPELRRMSREGTGRATVIVELEVPNPQVTIDRDTFRHSPWRALKLEPESADERRQAEDVKTRAKSFLEEIGEGPPVPLADDGSFAVQVDATALEALARSPLVRAIHASKLRR